MITVVTRYFSIFNCLIEMSWTQGCCAIKWHWNACSTIFMTLIAITSEPGRTARVSSPACSQRLLAAGIDPQPTPSLIHSPIWSMTHKAHLTFTHRLVATPLAASGKFPLFVLSFFLFAVSASVELLGKTRCSLCLSMWHLGWWYMPVNIDKKRKLTILLTRMCPF